MQNSRIIQVLKTFSEAEWKDFEKFATSPYFNNGRNYSALIKELKKFYPVFISDELKAENIYKKLFPGKSYKHTVMKTMMSGVYNLAQEYLIHLDYSTRPFKKEMALLYQLSLRNLDNIHSSHIRQLDKNMSSDKLPKDYFDMIVELQSHKVQHSFKSDYEKFIKDGIPRRGDYFIYNFITQLIAQIRDLYNMEHSLNYKPDRVLTKTFFEKINFDELLEYTNKYYPEIGGEFSAIVYCYLSSFSDDNRTYEIAKKNLFENLIKLSDLWIMNLVLALESATVIRLNKGMRKYIMERHELHKFMLERNLHIYEDLKYMHPRGVENFIALALWNKQTGWLEQFLKNHKHEFPVEYKESYIAYGNACLDYLNGNYTEVLKLVSKISDQLISLKLKVRTLQLKIYYELNETELAYSAIDSFRHFIRSNKNLGGDLKISMLEFTAFYEELLKLKLHPDSIPSVFLKKKVAASIPSFSNDWILGKLRI